ncbi:hypothetical protein Tcan_00378, partial [Toxocara canis]
VLIVVCVWFAHSGCAQLVCHVCNGTSIQSGNYCNNDNLCTGNSCTFDAQLSGAWSAGCSDEPIRNETTLCIVEEGTQNLSCNCGSNFCNAVLKMESLLNSSLPNGTFV